MDYNKIYNNLIERAKNRQLEGYTERHHIVPQCLGGNDDPHNLVNLTAREHFIAHQLLTKIHPTNRELMYAAVCMTVVGNGQSKRINNRLYEWLRVRRSKTVSEHMKTLWANNEHREIRLQSIRSFTGSDEFKEKQSIIGKEIWSKSPPSRKEQIKSIQKKYNKEVAKRNRELWNTEEYRYKMSQRKTRGSDGSKMKQKWADPQWREMMIESRKKKKHETNQS